MEVKPGYKQTEVGDIPEEWTSLRLSQIVQESRIPTGLYKEQTFYGNGSPIIKLGDVFGNDYFNPHIAQRVQLSCEEISRFRVHVGDIIIALASVKLEGVGKVMLVEDLHEDTVFDHNVALIRMAKGFDPKFVFYLFKSFIVRALISKRATQVGTTFLKASSILNFELPLPSTNNEQRAIATALSDVDGLLGGLDRLIAKKRDLKQAAMQQLLTGQTRLPGFHGEWEVKRLGELFEITSSKRVFQSEWKSEGIPFYRARELAVLGETGRVDNELFVTKSLYDTFRTAHGVPEVGDMLVTGVGTLGKVYVVRDEGEFYFKDGNIIWFKIRGAVSAEFLRQLYLTKVVMKQITDGSAGTTVGTYTISGAKKTEIPFPPLTEQTAIAEVLSDMDAELAGLTQRREKTRALKQAMMQELLTGRTRLIPKSITEVKP